MSYTKNEALKIMDLKDGVDKTTIRQTYKELALRWHPDKNTDREQATKKFQEISCAYKRLMTDGDDADEDESGLGYADIFAAPDLFDLFRHLYFAGHSHGRSAGLCGTLLEEMMQYHMYDCGYDDGGEYYDSDEYLDEQADGEEKEDDDDDFFDYDASSADFFTRGNKFSDKESFGNFRFRQVTEEEAKRNAEELMKEEETEKEEAKRKEDKRKNKNKRKKEAKKRKKAAQEVSSQGGASAKTSAGDPAKNEDEEDVETPKEDGDFDLGSAFVRGRKAAAAAASTGKASSKADGSGDNKSDAGGDDRPPADHASVGQTTPRQNPVSEELEDVSLQARSYAMRGNELAQLGHYQAAIDMFSEAIKLHGSDHRYYGNRSFCFDRLAQYHSAETDANKAIELSPEWPKGYFRRARSLAGQRQWKEAEDAFEVVLALDPACTDAFVELKKIRAFQLQEMGFSHEQSLLAIDKYQNVPQALDALLSGAVLQPDANTDPAYMAEEATPPGPASAPVQFTTRDDLRTPDASTGICSIWVGNVNHSFISQADIRALFAKFGEISSIRMMPVKHCVFVNYCTALAAANAMQDLQGYFLGDMNLTVRYPDSYLPAVEPAAPPHARAAGGGGGAGGRDQPTSSGRGRGRGTAASSSRQRGVGAQARAAAAREKERSASSTPAAASASPRSQTTECRKWRSANGCSFGKKCRYAHLPEHKGIDVR